MVLEQLRYVGEGVNHDLPLVRLFSWYLFILNAKLAKVFRKVRYDYIFDVF
jgi:hypothetical protein